MEESKREPQLYENHAQDSRVEGPLPIAPSVVAKYGTGGGNVPLVTQPLAIPLDSMNLLSRLGEAGENHSLQDFVPGDPMFTLTKAHHHAVACVMKKEEPFTYDLFQITAPLNRQSRKPGDPCHTLARDNASYACVVGKPDVLTNNPMQDSQDPIAFQPGNLRRQAGAGPSSEAFPTLKCDSGDQMPHVAYAQPKVYSFDSLASNSMKSSNPTSGCREVDLAKCLDTTVPCPSKNQGGIGIVSPDGENVVAPTVTTCKGSRGGCSSEAIDELVSIHQAQQQSTLAPTLTASNDPSRSPQSSEVTAQVEAVQKVTMQVRRLTPKECERLQGFPDNWTQIPWKGKPAEDCPDGPRYKACGNSMATPCMKWIGERIDAAHRKYYPQG